MVIQRWQSLFLLLVCILMGCFTFMSLGQFQLTDFSLNFTTLGITYEGEATGGAPTGTYASTLYFFILSITSFILPFIAIFLFKNLRLQKIVCVIEAMFIIAVIACGILIGYTAVSDATPSWSSIVIAPFISLVLALMAYNGVRRDMNLLRSVDRIR